LGGSRAGCARGIDTHGDLLIVASLFTALAWILLSKNTDGDAQSPVVTAYTIFSGTINAGRLGAGAVGVEPR